MNSESKIQVISRAASILRALNADGQTLSELAKTTGLPRSTVQRIVAALEEENFVETTACGVRLGWGLNELARFSYNRIAAELRDPLEKLFERTRETVDIATNFGADIHFLDRMISDQIVRVVPVNNRPRPLFSMANGKAILSGMSDEAIRSLFRGGMTPLTPNTIVNIDVLLREIQQVRETGFSYDNEEYAEGISGIGIPLPPYKGSYYALSVILPTFRLKARTDDIKIALKEAASACRTIIDRQSLTTAE